MTGVTFERDQPADYLRRLAESDVGKSYKSVALRELGIIEGQTVIDLGCGPGTDLRHFAAATGPTGVVVGIDSDPDAVATTSGLLKERPWVDVRLADIHSLDLPDASTDRAHADRVLQHVDEPSVVVAEACRILRAGGRAVFAEPDYDTLVIDYPDADVLRAYKEFISKRVVRNAHVGRQLARLAEQAGFGSTRTVPVTSAFRDAHQGDQIFGFQRVTRRAVAAGFLDQDEATTWLDHLATNTFFASATIFVVIADI